MFFYEMLKRFFDFVIAFAAIVVLLPVYIVIIVLIRLDSSGDAIFKQTRAGKLATPFTMYKFRTMKADTEPFGASPNTSNDPRITRLGKFLRETSLDELPQLWNVLCGDMSLVGPRPLYLSQICEWTDYQKRRLETRPGLTGLAQISGRGALTIEEKLNLDVQYVDSRCFRLDFEIIFATIMQVFSRKGIYEVRYSKKQKVRGQKGG